MKSKHYVLLGDNKWWVRSSNHCIILFSIYYSSKGAAKKAAKSFAEEYGMELKEDN